MDQDNNPHLTRTIRAMYAYATATPFITVARRDLRIDEVGGRFVQEGTWRRAFRAEGYRMPSGRVQFFDDAELDMNVKRELVTVHRFITDHLDVVGPRNMGLLSQFQFDKETISGYSMLRNWPVYGLFVHEPVIHGNQEAAAEQWTVRFRQRDGRIIIETDGFTVGESHMLNGFLLGFIEYSLEDMDLTPIFSKRLRE